MLSQEEQSEISGEFGRYERKSAACIEALRVIQRHRGWISDDAIIEIADFLQMHPSEVDGVATFYNLIFRKPVGRHVIFVCDSVSCWIMGCNQLKSHLNDRLGVGLGETTSDGAFTVLPIACLGRCENAPVMMVDGEPISNANVQSIDELLTLLRKGDVQQRRTG